METLGLLFDICRFANKTGSFMAEPKLFLEEYCMKVFIGKVLYFIGSGMANAYSLLAEHHVISEEAAWKHISKCVDLLEYAVLVLMTKREYRNFRCRSEA